MTLSEIKTKVPELQTKIADLVKQNATETKRLNQINADIKRRRALMKPKEAQIEIYKEFIRENSNDTDAKIQTTIKDYKISIGKIEMILKAQKDEIRKLEDERDYIKAPGTAYSKRVEETEKIQKELDEICDILVQDPTINYHMQTAVIVKFDSQIKKENDKREASIKTNEDIKKALKDGTKNGLKRILEDLKEGNDKYKAARTDPSIDPVDALKTFTDASNQLKNEVKAKFGVDLQTSDIDYILQEVEKGNLDSLTIPTLEKAIAKSDSIVKKLEESKDKRIESIKAKIAPDAQLTQEIEENKATLDNLNQELAFLSMELNDLDLQLAEKDTQIADKETALGEPSDDYKEFMEAEKELKDSHIITEELVPDLQDQNSDISKKYKEFAKADLEVRKAFQNCKFQEDEAKRPDDLTKLKDAIEKYKQISEELESLSGYDTEAWHNFLLEELNDKIIDGEVLDNAYYHTENENFKHLLYDKNTVEKYKCMDEYEAAENALGKLDAAQENILKGDFSADVEKLFTERDKGYYDSMKTLEKEARIKETNSTIYDLIKGNKPIKRRGDNIFTRFFKGIGNRFKTPKLFETPSKNQEVIDRFRRANKEGIKDEIAEREELDALKSERTILKSKRDVKEIEKAGKEDEYKVAQERKDELEQQVKAGSGGKAIPATDLDIRTVKYDDAIITAANEKIERDDDDGR